MTLDQARAVLREYPDADLSAFRILDADGRERDPDTLALTEGAALLARLEAMAAGRGGG